MMTRPRPEARAVNGVVVEAIPLLKGLGGVLLVVLVAPLQHGGAVVDADLLAVGLEDGLGVVEQVVGVDDGDGAALRTHAPLAARVVERLVQGRLVAGLGGADDALVEQVVEQPAQLVVPGLGGHELVEARQLAQRRDRAPVVGRDGPPRVPDQEGPVEATQHLGRHHRRVVLLGVVVCRPVDETVCVGGSSRRSSIVAVCGTVDKAVCVFCAVDGLAVVAVDVGAVGQVVAADEGRSNVGGLAVGREQIMSDVLDEDSLTLLMVSI